MLREFRTHIGQMQARVSRWLAAPDRWRRRRWARRWSDNASSVTTGSAMDPGALAREGFSLCNLSAQATSRLLQDWKALRAAHAEVGATRSEPRSTGKIFFEEKLSVADLHTFPAFVATALEESVLASLVQAMGMVPHLESVDILESRNTGGRLTASQLWHYDVNDDRILKLFVYLEDCFERNGPFTFIAADSSRRVSNVLGHYVEDERISSHVPRTEWRAVEGPAGTAFFIDTGRCYHYGSRCELPRYAYIATYSSGLRFMKRSGIWADVLRKRASALSPLQRTVCGLEQ